MAASHRRTSRGFSRCHCARRRSPTAIDTPPSALGESKAGFIRQIVTDEHRSSARERRLAHERLGGGRLGEAFGLDLQHPAAGLHLVTRFERSGRRRHRAAHARSRARGRADSERRGCVPCPRTGCRGEKRRMRGAALERGPDSHRGRISPSKRTPAALRRSAPCCPAAGSSRGANSWSMVARLRPLTRASAPFRRRATAAISAFSDGSTTTADGVSAISSKVPSMSRKRHQSREGAGAEFLIRPDHSPFAPRVHAGRRARRVIFTCENGPGAPRRPETGLEIFGILLGNKHTLDRRLTAEVWCFAR